MNKKWQLIVFLLLCLCACGGRENAKVINVDSTVVAVDTSFVIDSDETYSESDSQLGNEEDDDTMAVVDIVESHAFMKNEARSYPLNKDRTLRFFKLYRNVRPDWPASPDSFLFVLMGLKFELHKDTLIVTDVKKYSESEKPERWKCFLPIEIKNKFAWHPDIDPSFYFYRDTLRKYGSCVEDSILRLDITDLEVLLYNIYRDISNYVPIKMYIYDKYIIMRYEKKNQNCSLWLINPWYEEKLKKLARSKDTTDHFFEDPKVSFDAIKVDTTQTVIYSTKSFWEDNEKNRLESGKDDKYFHVIDVTPLGGYKCYLGEIPNGSYVKRLPDKYNGYNLLVTYAQYGDETAGYSRLYVYKESEDINNKNSIELSSSLEEDPFENTGDYRYSNFKIYKDFTIRVDGKRRIKDQVDEVSRYYRINDNGQIYELKGK